MTNNAKTLVTGANGFVGSALCTALGSAVRASARLPLAGAADQVLLDNLDGRTDWTAALRGCDAVVHLAAKVHVDARGVEAEYWQVNLEGTINLARQAKAAGVRRMVYLSTAKVHGEGRNAPYLVSDRLEPQGPYAQSKAAAEAELHRMQSPQFQICIVRPPLVFGPGAKGNFRKLFKLAASGVPLPFRAVHNRRSMISLSNLIDAIQVVLEHPAAAGKTYLVSDEAALSLPHLISMIYDSLDQPDRLFSVPIAALRALSFAVGKSQAFEKLAGNFSVDWRPLRDDTGWRPLVPTSVAMAQVAHTYQRAK